jgi:predicted ferric reductase
MNRTAAIWIGLLIAVTVPITAAAFSPLLAWRSPIYIAAGFAGIAAIAALFLQPIFAERALPGIHPMTHRRLHRTVGLGLVVAIIVHVGGLWITSPPDVVDALLFRSPTPFSVWGVIAMWGLFATALLASFKRRIRLQTWRNIHKTLAVIIILGTALHAFLIEGTMEPVSKTALCVLLLIATGRIIFKPAR